MTRYDMADAMRNVIDEQREEITALKAENARLRGERDMYRYLVSCMVHPDIPDQLAVENAKLRELLLELYEDQCDSGDQWRYLDRMRELGVVD